LAVEPATTSADGLSLLVIAIVLAVNALVIGASSVSYARSRAMTDLTAATGRGRIGPPRRPRGLR
jgi:hypothetical protein